MNPFVNERLFSSVFCRHSRLIPLLQARYVPAYDGVYISRVENDQHNYIMEKAEWLHRFINFSTTIGDLVFDLEMLGTFKAKYDFLAKKRSPLKIQEELYWLDQIIENLMLTYEILDETFSGVMTYFDLKDNGLNEIAEDFEKALIYRYPHCKQCYEIAKSLVEKNFEVIDIFLLAANIPAQFNATTSIIRRLNDWPDGRLLMFLRFCERKIEEDPTMGQKDLWDELVKNANECGISVCSRSSSGHIINFDGFLDTDVEPEINQKIVECVTIIQKHRQFEYNNGLKREHIEPFFTLARSGGKIKVSIRDDLLKDPEIVGIGQLFVFTITRNAILHSLNVCPLRYIDFTPCYHADCGKCLASKMIKTLSPL